MTHYEVLGVSRDATTAQIRSAFRRMARQHHPDTSAAASSEKLTAINEAWRVLGDPVLRRSYDNSLSSVSAYPANEASRPETLDTTPLAPPPESSFPWRFLAGLAAVGIAIALLGVFTYKPSKPAKPDNVLQQGSCVVIQDNGDASEVNCEDSHDGVVEQVLVGDEEQCAAELEPHRDQQGLGMVCIRFDV